MINVQRSKKAMNLFSVFREQKSQEEWLCLPRVYRQVIAMPITSLQVEKIYI